MADLTPNLEQIKAFCETNMVKHLGIEIVSVDQHHVAAKMPVDHRTQQPFGLLHGGASVVLAESLGSIGATLFVNPAKQYCVGLEINANHIKGVKEGYVLGVAKPVHIGKRTHVWEIKITNEAEELVCISRITMAVIDHK
ncbi:MAG: hotdog fold thioesterase [Flammeovirgaceae bacterium]